MTINRLEDFRRTMNEIVEIKNGNYPEDTERDELSDLDQISNNMSFRAISPENGTQESPRLERGSPRRHQLQQGLNLSRETSLDSAQDGICRIIPDQTYMRKTIDISKLAYDNKYKIPVTSSFCQKKKIFNDRLFNN